MLRVADEGFKTDTGRQRQANEDSFVARAPLYAVADGMGGAQAGEVASRIAVETFEESFDEASAPEGALRGAFERANGRIHARASDDATQAGMGTTLTAVHVGPEELAVGHVGDSRLYVLRDGELSRLTKDHSLVGELMRQGKLTEEQAESHPQKSIITRALGPEDEVQVDTMTYTARDGDMFLLCSDGLTSMVGDGEIARRLEEGQPLQRTVEGLVRAANDAGGRDNITVVAFRLADVEGAAPAEETGTLAGEAAERAGLTAEGVRAAAAEQAEMAEQTETRIRPADEDHPPAVAPRPTHGGDRPRRWRRPLLRVAAFCAVLAALGGAALLGLRQVHFLGTDEAGRVALYRGLPYDLPAGVNLYERRYASPMQTGRLRPVRRRAVRDHELRSRANAADLIRDIEREVGVARDAGGGER